MHKLTLDWFHRASVRAVKTMAQVAVSMLTVGGTLNDIDWIRIGSVALVAGIASMLTSLAGLPEVEAK